MVVLMQESDKDVDQRVQEPEEEWTLDILPYPDEGQVISPCIPYTGALPAPLTLGHMVVVDGEVLPNATRLAVDLICGLSSKCDVALHVNPRFDELRVVRNTRTNEKWGEEEAASSLGFPLRRGEQFFLYIFVTETQFLIAFNGRHFCAFEHRMPLWRIHALHVSGDVKVFQIEHRRGVAEYPQPSDMVAATSLAVPTESCPANLNSFCTHITNPDTPFIGNLPLGLDFGRQVEIIGKIKLLPNSFYINLQKGKTTWPSPAVVFHFNPRFKEGHIVIRNSKISGKWGSEERGGPASPFTPGLCFLLTIICEKDHFRVLVDGVPYVTYKYRCDLTLVDTVLVEGDVHVTDIYIR